MAKSRKAAPAATAPMPPAPVGVAVTRALDLTDDDRAWAVWRPREVLPRPEPAPFDFGACRERLLKIKKGYYGWLEWGSATIAPVLTRKEAHFWFLALTHDKEKPEPSDVADTISEKGATGEITAEQVLNRIRDAKVYYPNIGLDLLFNLFDPVEMLQLMQNDAVNGAPNNPAGTAADQFTRHVLAYLDAKELTRLKDALRPLIAPALWPAGSTRPPVAFFVAARAGMPDELLPVVRAIPDDAYSGNSSWAASYHDPLRLAFGLGTPQLVEAEARRLQLKLWGAERVRAWLALTEFAALDYARDQILAESRRDECERLLRALACANAPEVAPHMLELKLNAKGPGPAREWLAENVANAIVGLVPTAAGRGKLAEAAIEYLRDAKRKGHEAFVRAAVEASPPAIADAVRKSVLEHTEKTYSLVADTVLPADLKAGFADAKAKKANKLPAWATPAALPPILIGDGKFSDEQVLTVLEALQRSAPDAPGPLVAAVRKHADRGSLDAFAWKLFQLWQGEGYPPKEKWALGAIGPFGGDMSALKLTPLVRNWPGESQHQRAVFGLLCLRGIGSDTALMQLNGIAQKLKFKGLKQKATDAMEAIAREKGLTRAQLEDRVVPDCDLDEKGQRVFDFGPRQFRFALGADMKPMIKDADGKVKSDLPKPGKSDDAAKANEAVAAWKLMKKQIKEVVSVQSARLEQAMVTGRRWPAADFEALLVKHPLMIHLVRLLVWGTYDKAGKLAATFRVTEDQTFADARDTVFKPTGAEEVGVVHPLHLSDEQKAGWGELFGDYEIVPPFPQLGRSVYKLEPGEVKETELTRYDGVGLPAPTLVFGLENRGWHRGGGGDGGGFSEHTKAFPGCGVSAVVDYDGSVGFGYIDPNETIKFGSCYFVAGASRWGAKKLELGTVDPVAVSEVLSDLGALAAKAK